MSKKKSHCPYDDPDCFNCPFDDCKASLVDLNRQRAAEHKREYEKRNQEIVYAFTNGASIEGLADRCGVQTRTITVILNQNGIRFRRRRKKNGNETD